MWEEEARSTSPQNAVVCSGYQHTRVCEDDLELRIWVRKEFEGRVKTISVIYSQSRR